MKWYSTTLTIVSGGTTSPSFDVLPSGRDQRTSLLIMSPTTLPETVSVQVSIDNTTFVTLQSGAVDITCPAAKGTQIVNFLTRYVRLLAGGAVAADRTFTIVSYGELP